MKKKVKGSSPAIDRFRLANDIINPSLERYFISLIDYNDVKNQYSDYDDEDYDITYDEGIEEYLTTTVDLFEYIEKATTKTIDIIKNTLKLFLNYEIVAFNISEAEDNRITFFLKNSKEHFTMLTLLYCYEINVRLFMNNIVNLEEFRCYGNNNSDLHGFYMKDDLIEYEFDILKYKDLNFIPRRFLLTIEPVLGNKSKGVYFVIKNSAADPVIMTHLSNSDDIETFNNALTKADPQAGLLFSLSYNANK